eukprot:533302_1
MEELIQFRSRIDLLTNDEFIVFIKSFPKHYFINMLFEYFKNQFQNSVTMHQWQNNILPRLDIIKNKVDDIIDSRSDSDDIYIQNIQQQNSVALDDLPFVLISSISSYLTLKETLSFEKVNRCIFIGTRSPISMKTMAGKDFTKCVEYSNINECLYNFYRFNSIKQLTINVNDMIDEFYDYNEYRDEYNEKTYCFIDNVSTIPIYNNLQILSIKNDETVMLGTDACFIEELNTGLLSNITTFRWDGDAYCDHISLKNSFRNLYFLELYTTDIVLDMVDNMFDVSKLRGLSIKPNADDYQPIISRICNKLESFHCNMQRDDQMLLTSQNKFLMLKELCLVSCPSFNHELINVFLEQNLDSLEKIHWDIGNVTNSDSDYRMYMQKLLSVNSLNYISIKCEGYKQLIMVFDILKNALKDKHKLAMKIRIVRDQIIRRNAQGEEVGRHILKLANCLDKVVNNFMLICHIKRCKIDLTGVENKYLVHDYLQGLVVLNKECNINGYRQKWIMNCNRCNDL